VTKIQKKSITQKKPNRGREFFYFRTQIYFPWHYKKDLTKKAKEVKAVKDVPRNDILFEIDGEAQRKMRLTEDAFKRLDSKLISKIYVEQIINSDGQGKRILIY
jgi:hypothetical protein